MVDRIRDRDGEPAAQHEVQRVGDVALVEQHVAADQVLLATGGCDGCQHLVRRIGEEFSLGKEVFVSHVSRTVLPSPVVSLPAAEIVWTIVVAGGTGSRIGRAKQYEQVGSRRVVDHAADIARAASDGVVVVVPPGDVAAEGGVAGGATRSESVRAGLAEVPRVRDHHLRARCCSPVRLDRSLRGGDRSRRATVRTRRCPASP